MGINEPIIQADGFWDDIVNLFCLRPVWRKPADESRELRIGSKEKKIQSGPIGGGRIIKIPGLTKEYRTGPQGAFRFKSRHLNKSHAIEEAVKLVRKQALQEASRLQRDIKAEDVDREIQKIFDSAISQAIYPQTFERLTKAREKTHKKH